MKKPDQHITRQILDTDQKALEINLNDSIYGSFAEIGAGQEVARYFFKVGAAAGTIAKTMSAYDKIVSDDIYGAETSGRYVCESRLYKMLDHEYALMEKRLRAQRSGTKFFAFADTVSAINFQRSNRGDGWLGLRFQLHPDKAPNDIVLHVRMHDQDTQLQHSAIGILGVNLIYACFHYHQDPETMLVSLTDQLHGRISIDMVRITGPDFEHLDDRLITLWLVSNDLTEVAMFRSDGQSVHASEFLYKKHVMIARGSFRPFTNVNADMIREGFEQFKNEEKLNPGDASLLVELPLHQSIGKGQLDEKDYLDRVEILRALGFTIAVSNCSNHQQLIQYLSEYKIQHLAFVLGVRRFQELITGLYEENHDGRMLSAFGEVFTEHVRFYVYPAMQEGQIEPMNIYNMPVPEGLHYLYRHLLNNRQVVDIVNFNPRILHIFSKEVLKMIKKGEAGWEQMVPDEVAKLIRSKGLFGYTPRTVKQLN